MIISIETTTDVRKTYQFNVESSTTIQQLKEHLRKKTGDSDVNKIDLVFNGRVLEKNDKTLSYYHVKEGSELKLIGSKGAGNMGMEFVDVSNRKGLKRAEFSQTGDEWRKVQPGMCLVGTCKNGGCVAKNQEVVVPIGYGEFDLLAQSVKKSICPICTNYVEPITCSFNNCRWKYKGIKIENHGDKVPKECQSEWTEADNAFHYFAVEISGKVTWRQLIFQIEKI